MREVIPERIWVAEYTNKTHGVYTAPPNHDHVLQRKEYYGVNDLIEWLEGQKKCVNLYASRFSVEIIDAHNAAIDAVIEKLKGITNAN